jgi:hypothetical protein
VNLHVHLKPIFFPFDDDFNIQSHNLVGQNQNMTDVYCQAQPKLQVQLEAALALFPLDPATATPNPTHPQPPHPIYFSKNVIQC